MARECDCEQLLTGQTLDGTYYLQRLVGEGGMGVVYEATHARLAGRYAIKVLLRELSDNAAIRARFQAEARITSLLQHPNVVQVIDHNTTVDGTSYLVMEYLAGESLADRLRRVGRLPVVQVVDIVDQIAAGLAAAHARDIVHRDLKPDNVFLLPVEGRGGELVKILDFGISKTSWTREATEREICGTPQYMAPEQAEGRVDDIDAQSDQYALAMIAHEMLTGTNLHAADSLAAMLERIRAGVVVAATGLPGAVDSVLARALAKDKAARFRSVSAFADALRASAALAVNPEPPPAAAARRARPRARSWPLVFAAAGAIALTSFIGSGSANRAPPPPPADHRLPPPAAEAASTSTSTPIVIPAVAEDAVAETMRPPDRRGSAARPARDDRPRRSIPTAPARRAPRRALAPDEDATLPPSAF